MADPTTTTALRILLNVGHGEERRYVRRYQRALDVVLALVEPYAEALSPAYSTDRPGSDYGRGFADGLHVKAHQVLHETTRALLADDNDNQTAEVR